MAKRSRGAWIAVAMIEVCIGAEIAAADERRRAELREAEQRLARIDRELAAAGWALDETERRMQEQSDLLATAGLAPSREAGSGLPGFLGTVEANGWAAVSYLYGWNDPSDAANGGLGDTLVGASRRAGSSYGVSFMHPDHNSFAFDQLWLEIFRPVDETQRAGFWVDLLFGKDAALLGGPSSRADGDDTGFFVFQAYLQYLAPITENGITVRAGRFYTLLGIEGVQAQWIYNWNISRGNVWALFEPTNHTGVSLATKIGDTGFDVAVAGVNGFAADSPDRNDAKSVTGHIGWSNGPLTLGLNGIWGAEEPWRDGGSTSVLNALLVWMPSDRFGLWVDADWGRRSGDGDPSGFGVAVAARFGITERTDFAVRGEYVTDDDGYTGFVGRDGSGALVPTDIDLWSLTGTVDHRLTDHLLLRGELRWDRIHKDSTDDGEFLRGSRFLDDDQVTAGIELLYSFNAFGGG